MDRIARIAVLGAGSMEPQPYFREMPRCGWLANKTVFIEKLRPRKRSTSACRNTGPSPSQLTDLIQYSHRVAPQIAHTPPDLDLAMRWGYGWSLGPFQIESAIA